MSSDLDERLRRLFPRFEFDGSLMWRPRENMVGYRAGMAGEVKCPTVKLDGHYSAEELSVLAEWLTCSNQVRF